MATEWPGYNRLRALPRNAPDKHIAFPGSLKGTGKIWVRVGFRSALFADLTSLCSCHSGLTSIKAESIVWGFITIGVLAYLGYTY